MINLTNRKTRCDDCAYYAYDDDCECYVCEINPDEDEMLRFMQGTNDSCPYYRLGDEYSVVRKQN